MNNKEIQYPWEHKDNYFIIYCSQILQNIFQRTTEHKLRIWTERGF